MMLSWLIILFLGYPTSAFSAKTCKCLPGDACFPSDAAWDAFSKTLSQPLIQKQRPLASVCYETSPNFETHACNFATANQFNTVFLATVPNATQWTIFEALVTNNSVEQCAFNPGPKDICFQGRVPVYSVNATTAQDIQSAFRFATTHNLHLVVRNTGHELLGRTFGVGALEIFMNRMRGIQIDNSFVPEGAPEMTAGQPAVHLGPGENWADVYVAVNNAGRSIPGGFSVDGTVGAAGGWSLGGGHSVLSPHLGLGVDNALQYTVVLPSSEVVVANNYTNTDLFWALRGGGGPSFGVVVQTTFKTHPSTSLTVAFYEASANTTVAFRDLLTLWMQYHNAVSDAGWSGVWPFGSNSFFMTMFTPGAPPSSLAANRTLQAFFDASATISGVTISEADTFTYSSWEEYNFDNLVDSAFAHGLNFSNAVQGGLQVYESSWILPRAFTSPSNASNAADLFLNLTASIALPWMVGGGVVAEIDPDAMSVNPAFRKGITDLAISETFNTSSNIDLVVQRRQSVHDQLSAIRTFASESGQYLNEPDFLLEDWQTAYWGDHYPRLLALKQKIDPNDLLIVYKGVNSEDWDIEITCKTT